MKKTFSFLLLTFILGGFLVGCQNNPQGQPNPSPTSGLPTAFPPPSQNPPNPNPPTPNPSSSGQTFLDGKVFSPDLTKPISSPVTIKGEISGTFFFEGTFPVILKDAKGKILAATPAKADSDWTQKIVPFTVTLTFPQPVTATGTLIFKNDNPSGLPQNEISRSFPVKFAVPKK